MARQGLPVPTHQDETLPQRYAREHQDYLKLCGSMTAEQVADLQLQLNNSLAREQALQQRLTAADERVSVLETALRKIKARLDAYSEADMRMPESSVEVCQMIADAALKPAEGVGDDTTLEEDREDFKKVFVRINTKQGQSISLADMIARYEKKP